MDQQWSKKNIVDPNIVEPNALLYNQDFFFCLIIANPIKNLAQQNFLFKCNPMGILSIKEYIFMEIYFEKGILWIYFTETVIP